MVGVCSPFSLGMNMLYSHVQFHFQTNETFKSNVSLIQKLKGTKKFLKHLVPHWIWGGHLKCLNREIWE